MCQSCYLYHQSLSDCPLSVSASNSHISDRSKIRTSRTEILKQVTFDPAQQSNTFIRRVIRDANYQSQTRSPDYISSDNTDCLTPWTVINRLTRPLIGQHAQYSPLIGCQRTAVSSIMQSIKSSHQSFYPWAVQISAHYQVSRTWQIDNYKWNHFN